MGEALRAVEMGLGAEHSERSVTLAREWLANTPHATVRDDMGLPAVPFTPPHTSNPEHYQRDGIEPIDVIEAWGLDFRLANAIKYIARAGRKPGESRDADLEKAANYIHRARFGRWPWEVDND